MKYEVINVRNCVMKYEKCTWRASWFSLTVLWFSRHTMFVLVCPLLPIDFTCYIHELWHSKSHKNAGWTVYKFHDMIKSSGIDEKIWLDFRTRSSILYQYPFKFSLSLSPFFFFSFFCQSDSFAMSLLAQIFSAFLYLFLSYLSLFLSRFHFRPVSSLSSSSPTGICFRRLDPLLWWLRFPLLARTISIPLSQEISARQSLLFHTWNVTMSISYDKKNKLHPFD